MTSGSEQMASTLILNASKDLLIEQNEIEQSPDPLSLPSYEDYSNAKDIHDDDASGPLLSTEVPSWTTLHNSQVQSEPSSNTDEPDYNPLNLHPSNNSNLSTKAEEPSAGSYAESIQADSSPTRTLNKAKERSDTQIPATFLCNRTSPSTSTQFTIPSKPLRTELTYSAPPSPNTNALATSSQAENLNTGQRPIRPRSKFIEVAITKPPRSRGSTRELSSPAASSARFNPNPKNPLFIVDNSNSTPGIPSSDDVEPPHPPSTQRGSSRSSVALNDESLEVSQEGTNENKPITSLANALTSAFIKNAQRTQPVDYRPEQRLHLPMTIKAAPINADTSTLLAQMRDQPDQRQSYFRKSKVSYLLNEKGKGRVLDDDEYAELLDADEAKITFGTEISTTDHVRRSNLRHLRPPVPGVIGDTWKSPNTFAKPTVSRDDMFFDILERTFGPDSYWGTGPKPKSVMKYPATSDGSRATSSSGRSGYESDAEENNNSETPELDSTKRRTTGDGDDRQSKRSRTDNFQSTSISPTQVDEWTAPLQGLIKGKTKMNREEVTSLDILMNSIDEAKENISFEVARDSKLLQTIRQVSELSVEDVPFEDEHDLRQHARTIASYWSLKWSKKVESD